LGWKLAQFKLVESPLAARTPEMPAAAQADKRGLAPLMMNRAIFS